ncbi:MAG: RDD family protein [Microbacteriaceae bacterium]
MPVSGPGSVARFGRRLIALCIDYALAVVVALLIAPYQSATHSLATLVIFAVTQVFFIPTLGGSIGHRALGMRLLAIDGTWVGWRRPIIRTVLLVLVIPALVWDSDQRGFHDKVAGTVLVRTN